MRLAMLLCILTLLFANVSAGHRLATGNRAPRRALSQLQAEDFTASGGIFSTVTPCPGLVEILTDTPDSSSSLGNFTEMPTQQLLMECTEEHSVYFLSGETLAAALDEPTPLLKIATLEPAHPTIWPQGTVAPHLAPFSVNVIDCHDQLLDMRNRSASQPTGTATLIYLRCTILFPDVQNTWRRHSFFFDTMALFPCNGTSSASESADYPLSKPKYFETLSANLGPGNTVNVVNYTVACYTAEDLEQLYRDAVHTHQQQENNSSVLPSWALWAVIAGGVALVCAVLATVWMCCGRPCCSCQLRRSKGDIPLQQGKPYQQQSHQRSDFDPATQDTSGREAPPEELVSALGSVLNAYKVREAKSKSFSRKDNSASATTSDSTKFQVPSYELRECPDCGQPHAERVYHSCRSRSQHMTTASYSGSGSAGARRGATMLVRENDSNSECVSVDGHFSCNTGSISFAPHSIVGGTDSIACSSTYVHTSLTHAARDPATRASGRRRMKGLDTWPSSVRSQEFFDAEEDTPTSPSFISSPRSETSSRAAAPDSPNRAAERKEKKSAEAFHDMHSSKGSPRNAVLSGGSGSVHPLFTQLSQYSSPPPPYPRLHQRLSQERLRELLGKNGGDNDLEASPRR